jgi:transposase
MNTVKSTTLYVGLDVHKETISVAYAVAGSGEPPVYVGAISSGYADLEVVLRRLHSKAATLELAYEAGPTGYGLYRHLTAKGYRCVVAAPSLVPKRPGDKVKTDRRNACDLARLLRSGDLTGIWVPSVEDEAIRDVSRARDATRCGLKRAKQRLKSFLLRLGMSYSGRADWTAGHRRYLAKVVCPTPAQQIVYQELLHAVDEQEARLRRLEDELHSLTEGWRLQPVVTAVQALRGVQWLVALTVLAELGDLTRFASPRQLAAFVGLIPSEYSSGETRRQGSITKSGNSRARRALVEAAWAYRHPAKVSPQIQQRLEALPPAIQAIAWKAQVRLCRRYRRLVARGKHTNTVIAAIARELVAFMWAIAREVPLANA